MNLTSETAIHRIRSYAKDSHITKSRLAEMSGLDDKTLQDFWEECWNPQLNTIRKIEAVIPENYNPLTQSKTKVKE